ncbi:hypothetical protein RD792_002293 [Penstemon davidsonii]|uniref:Toprim domain-containing protein n=1 Tax=Penstemon davidsonii TaxID=160366 RepID=A0ABR0DRC3_9LAMI|nr:hypothetical protein RD792_002293 [Penstemon davidsonii]
MKLIGARSSVIGDDKTGLRAGTTLRLWSPGPTPTIGDADIDDAKGERAELSTKLKRKIEALGINVDSCTPGLYDLLYCPMVFADTKKAYNGINLHSEIDSSQPLTEENLRLEMLGDELLTYFAERMISKETLERNNVMQVAGDRKIIAFTYRQNGVLVGCKYRTIEKKYWQERNTEKMLYGIDDIAEADEIIIVEGELDKLSVEEAGYYNCVSVPSGAPQTVSLKELPSPEKDVGFQYIWNCKDYLDKASRIILATDSDIPGQALAEELSRRLGRERCWVVHWPKKDEFSSFKDANDVLKNMGADALRDAIHKAELYQVQNLN